MTQIADDMLSYISGDSLAESWRRSVKYINDNFEFFMVRMGVAEIIKLIRQWTKYRLI